MEKKNKSNRSPERAKENSQGKRSRTAGSAALG